MASFRISAIIPTYNRASLVRRAVESALEALLPEDEVIVVVDGSTDGTLEALARYGDRIRVLTTPRAGVSAARNLGMRQAAGELVAFLDDDDQWMPDKMQLQRAVMESRPDVVLCFSDFAHRTVDGEEIHGYLSRWHRDTRPWSEILGPGVPFSSLGPLPEKRGDFLVHIGDLYPSAMLGDYVCTSTATVRRKTNDELEFPEDLSLYEDWELFARVARTGSVAMMSCESQWNCASDGYRLTQADALSAANARVKVLERVWGSDPSFLADHGDAYREVRALHRRARARLLIAEGRTREARQDLRFVDSATVAERLAAALPGPVARTLARARHRFRRGSHRSGSLRDAPNSQAARP